MQVKALAVFGISLATALSGAMPAQAFPSFSGPSLENLQVQQVKNQKWRRHHGGDRHSSRNGGGRNHHGGGHHHDHDGGGHWNGHHGGSHHGHHHGNHDGDFDAVFGGLAAGAIIGGLIAQPYGGYYAPRYYGPQYPGASSHVGWCYSRYRSYRAYDNTYQPYYGQRRECISPYL